ERFDPERLAADLRGRGVPARMVAVSEMIGYLKERLGPGDTVAVMSSGGFDGLHGKLLEALGHAVIPAASTDYEAIAGILETVGLPREGVKENLANFLLLRDEGKNVGCVGLEIYDEVAVLRSLAVIPERRGEGLGWMLADRAVDLARQRG